MIRLAMREEEYGSEITHLGPNRKEYVKGHAFIFLFLESLLYLFFSIVILAGLFLYNGYSLPMTQGIMIIVALGLSYAMVTVLGVVYIRRTSAQRYESIKQARKEYKKDLKTLALLMENEE